MPRPGQDPPGLGGQPVVQVAVEAGERFVQQQHDRFRRERAGEGDPLGLPARERSGRAPLEACRARRAARSSATRSRHGPSRSARHPQPEPDVGGHVEMGEQLLVLEHQPDPAAVGRDRREVAAVPRDATAVGLMQPGDDAQQRRLARATGPEHGDDLSGRRREVDRVEHGAIRRTRP